MENTCAHCESTYSRPPSLIGSFCSASCAYQARRQQVPAHRRIRRQLDHPLAGKTGLVSEARAVLFDKIGPGMHSCHWCGHRVQWRVGKRGNTVDALIADHVDNDAMNDLAINLVPSCGACNASRTQKIGADELLVTRPNGTRARAIERKCKACDGLFLAPSATLNRPNKGHFCSRTCARSAPRAKPL